MTHSSNHLPTIIFDFGGVLLDWDPRYLYRKIFNGDEAAMERFLSAIDFNEWNMQQDAGRPFAEAVEIHCQRHPAYCDLIRAYHARWEESIAGPIQPVVEILAGIKADGYPLAALSNWSAETFRLVRHRYAFLDWFDTILISGEVKLAKPDPRIFSILLERLGKPAEECLFIDDSAANITTAQQLGFITIHFHSPEQLEGDLRRLGIHSS